MVPVGSKYQANIQDCANAQILRIIAYMDLDQ